MSDGPYEQSGMSDRPVSDRPVSDDPIIVLMKVHAIVVTILLN